MRHAQTIRMVGLVALVASPLAAQPPPRDSAYQQLLDFPRLVKGGRITPHWAPDGGSFWYLDPASDRASAWRVELPGGRVTPFDLADSAVVTGPRGVALAGGFPSPDGRWIAFDRDWNVWVRDASNGQEVALTTDGVAANGWTRRPFYGRPVALQWSPDSRRLLAVRMDARHVTTTTIVTWLDQANEQVVRAPYPLTGGAVEQVQVCILSSGAPTRVCLDTGPEADQILYPLGWRSDGSEALAIRLDRSMKRLDLLAADPATGRTRVVVSDTQATFIEGLGLVHENLAYPLADGRRVIWRSERDGWSHLYLYDWTGRLTARLTNGSYPVDRVVAVDEGRGWVYFLGRGDRRRPYDVHLYRVDLTGKRLTQLTEATGEHDVAFSPELDVFLDTHSTVDRPPRTDLRRADGRLIRILSAANIDALTALGWRAPEEFTIKAADGTTDLWGALYRPTDFDPARRYPVVDLQYMGNFRQSAPHRFVTGFISDEAHALAQLGFIVVVLDGRGTTGRGKAFQDVTYMNLGGFEVADHAAAIRQLAAARPFMDTTRVGITGFSWGGYYTIRALLTHGDLFTVGVSGAPVVDLHARWNRIEPYMGTPQSNPDGYARASNPRLASRLEGKLMIAIGTSDSNVTFTHPMRMADALIRAGRFFDLIVLPGETHSLSPAAQRYYVEARARYLVEHLEP